MVMNMLRKAVLFISDVHQLHVGVAGCTSGRAPGLVNEDKVEAFGFSSSSGRSGGCYVWKGAPLKANEGLGRGTFLVPYFRWYYKFGFKFDLWHIPTPLCRSPSFPFIRLHFSYGAARKQRVGQVFSSLPTVAERRKKHMAWIHKSQPEAPKSEEDPFVPRVPFVFVLRVTRRGERIDQRTLEVNGRLRLAQVVSFGWLQCRMGS